MKVKFSFGRDSRDVIRVRIRDEASGIEFVSLEMTPHDALLAITGMSEMDAECEVHGLQYVGKTRVTELRTIECPLDPYDRKALAEWLKANAQEDGWIVQTYLGSQNSVRRLGDKTLLQYSVRKYVETETPKDKE